MSEQKKISLKEAIQQKLAQKKQEQHDAKLGQQQRPENMQMKSQQTKKVNNQRRRTGGS